MSAKSKHNRRQVSRGGRLSINPGIREFAGEEKPGTSQAGKTIAPDLSGPSLDPAEGPLIVRELKWIGIVTLIILFLLVISYFLFR